MGTQTLPNVLVTTGWVAQHATDAGVRFHNVKNSDGSWTEWGNLVGAGR